MLVDKEHHNTRKENPSSLYFVFILRKIGKKKKREREKRKKAKKTKEEKKRIDKKVGLEEEERRKEMMDNKAGLEEGEQSNSKGVANILTLYFSCLVDLFILIEQFSLKCRICLIDMLNTRHPRQMFIFAFDFMIIELKLVN